MRFEWNVDENVAGANVEPAGIAALSIASGKDHGSERAVMPVAWQKRALPDLLKGGRGRQGGGCGHAAKSASESARVNPVQDSATPKVQGRLIELRSMNMVRLILSLLVAAAMAAPAAMAATSGAAAREEPVTYRSGEIELAALLLLPEGTGPHPAAVIVQGSGDSDRNNAWARAIAEMVRQEGYAVLLTDKRGSGESGGDWRSVGFETLADDALAGVAALAARPDINSARIGLVGLSQGGRVVPVAAARSDRVAFVINMVGDAVSFAEQSAHEMANIARQAGLPESMQQEVRRLNATAGRALLTGEWDEYRRLRQEGLASPWAPVARGFPPSDDPIWTFYGKAFAFDPMPYWTLVQQPVLILYGEQDEADNVAVGESVRRLTFGFGVSGKDNYEIAVVPGVGHALGWTPDGGLGTAAVSTIRRWLAERH